MLNHIINFSLNQRIFVSFGLLVLIVTGVISFKNLPVEAFADVTDIQVNVITLYPGRAAEEVEKQVTIPVEIALAGIPNSIRVFSHTQFGLSFLMVTFNDKTIYPMAQKLLVKKNTGKKTYDDKTFRAMFMAMDKAITKEQRYKFFKDAENITNISYNSQY